MMHKHLILKLEAPLMAFGGEAIDNLGVIRPFPAASMLTGMLANVLGWRRVERDRIQTLQDRLVFAARIDRESHTGLTIQDFQSAAISNKDQAWTTHGEPEGRAGGTYTNWLRYRDYHADMIVTVAVRLKPENYPPTLNHIAEKLENPSHPPFIGRKPCLPSRSILGGFAQGDTSLAALLSVPLETQENGQPPSIRILWPEGEDAPDMTDVRATRHFMLTDQRNWTSGLHGGARPVCQGTAHPRRFPKPRSEENRQQ